MPVIKFCLGRKAFPERDVQKPEEGRIEQRYALADSEGAHSAGARSLAHAYPGLQLSPASTTHYASAAAASPRNHAARGVAALLEPPLYVPPSLHHLQPDSTGISTAATHLIQRKPRPSMLRLFGCLLTLSMRSSSNCCRQGLRCRCASNCICPTSSKLCSRLKS
eukprot:scaffold1650_cov351-Prasinococcus_capsulatus_cf.AAC.23